MNKDGKKEVELHLEDLPKLYKYQQIGDYSLNHFLNDEVWGTTANAFNDPYDSMCCFSLKHFQEELRKKLTSEQASNFKKLFNVKTIDELITHMTQGFQNGLNENRKQRVVSCFTETVDNEIMWAHYANNAKGFALEYDGCELREVAITCNNNFTRAFQELNLLGYVYDLTNEENPETLLPIIYMNGKHNATNSLIKQIDSIIKYYDDLANGDEIGVATNKFIKEMSEKNKDAQDTFEEFYSSICNKLKAWEYEKEWRIWAFNFNVLAMQINNPHCCIGNVRAKAIYLGEQIEEYHRTALINIAREKNIKVFQMQTKEYKHNFKLIAVEIKENDANEQ